MQYWLFSSDEFNLNSMTVYVEVCLKSRAYGHLESQRAILLCNDAIVAVESLDLVMSNRPSLELGDVGGR
jgi:hypothetical protein